MAETNALLKRHTGNCIEGSNPSVSASQSTYCKDWAYLAGRIPGKRHFLGLNQTQENDFCSPSLCETLLFSNGQFRGTESAG